jgi:hypothetical protein
VTDTIEPKEGHRYRVTFEFTAKSVRSNSVVHSEDGGIFLRSLGEWEELEPAYVEGALYLDAKGVLWVRSETSYGRPGWVAYKDTLHPYYRGNPKGSQARDPYVADHNYPERPLTRLYREEEK